MKSARSCATWHGADRRQDMQRDAVGREQRPSEWTPEPPPPNLPPRTLTSKSIFCVIQSSFMRISPTPRWKRSACSQYLRLQ